MLIFIFPGNNPHRYLHFYLLLGVASKNQIRTKEMNMIRDFFNLVYPRVCPTCGTTLPRQERFVCPKCWIDLPKTDFHREPENQVEQIFWGRFPVKYAAAFFYYTKGSRYQRLIHEMKYKGKKEIGYELGKKFGMELKESPFSQTDYIIPVPLHRKKQKKRGFNQSEWIASGIAEMLNASLSANNLFRSEHTKSQTKKSRHDRWKNVENVFRLRDKDVFKNKNLLLVDDILTTGATLEACAHALMETENITVSVATLGFSTS